MSKKLLIKNGIVICPDQNIEEKLDLLIEDDQIVDLKKDINIEADEILDVSGKYICPGLIDMHCHLKEPGREDIGTILSGSQSASAGGYSTIACMPNTNPVIDNQMGIEYIYSKAKEVGLINILPIGAVTKKTEGQELTEISALVNTGAVALSDDENTIMDSSLMRRALEYSTMFNIPIIAHCEDRHLSENGCVNEGDISSLMGFKGTPSISEEIMVSRDIMLTDFTQSRLHIAHVSTEGSIELIRKAKEKGVNISCEVTPHHFALSEMDLYKSNYNTNFKVSPPLRTENDIRAIQLALKDGTIDTISSDHNPWLDTEKDNEFINSPDGIINFETTLPIIFDRLIKAGHLSFKEAIAKLTINPAKILNLDSGSLRKGSIADICIVDPDLELEITPKFFYSISKNSPFIGEKLKGFNIITIVNGQIVFNRNENKFYRRKSC